VLKVILFAPIHTSLYARLVLHGLQQEEKVQVVGVVVCSPWSIQRIHSEWRRDGRRLLQKFIRKYLLREKVILGKGEENLASLAVKEGLTGGSLKGDAQKVGVPYLVCRNFNEKKCIDFIRACNPHVIVFTGGGLIRQKVLELPQYGVLNCHSGVLPSFRGMDIVEWTALTRAIAEVGFGVTLHYMDKGVDTGPILLVHRLELSSDDTFATIRMRLEVEMVRTMLEGVHGIAFGSLQSTPQRLEDGKQYFVMHRRVKKVAEKYLQEQLKG